MKRPIAALLALWLSLLVGSAHATALYTFDSRGNAVSAGSTAISFAMSGHIEPNNLLVGCVFTGGGSSAGTSFAASSTAGSWTQIGTTLTQGTNALACFKHTAVSSDTGDTFTATWTNGNVANAAVFDFGASDNIAPTVGTPQITSATSVQSITPTAITPGQSGDLILVVGANANDGHAAFQFGHPLFFNNSFSANTFAVSSTGAATMPIYGPQGSSTTMLAFAVAIQGASAGSAIGAAGAPSFTSGSANAVNPGFPTNINVNDPLFAVIYESGTGIAITPPAALDIQLRMTAETNPGSQTSVVSVVLTGVHSGDLMTAWTVSSTAHPFTGCTSNSVAWTQYKVDNTNSNLTYWYKVAAAGDVGATLTCTATGNDFLQLFAKSWYSISGGSVTVHAGSIQGCASSTTCVITSITTSVNNTLIEVAAEQFASVTYTIPKEVTNLFGNSFGFYGQAAAGASITPTYTSSAAHGWEGGQIALTSTGAVAGPAWTLVASSVDPSATEQLNLYSLSVPSTGLIGNPQKFYFASNPANSSEGIILDAGNLNTTTPVDVSNTLSNAGMSNVMEASLPLPTSSDELALSCIGTSGPPGSSRTSEYPQSIIVGSRIACNYTRIDAAVVPQIVNNSAGSYASITLGLKAASTPARTNANVDINQHVIEIFSTTAPSPPASTGAWFF